jgi:hypothetical protein
MASLEQCVTQEHRNALGVREKRQGNVLKAVRGTQPAQIAMRLRRVAMNMGKLVDNEELPVSERVAAAKAMMEAQAQLLDVIGWPKRPTPAPVKPGRLPPPVDITPDPIPQTVQDLARVSPEQGI